MNPENKIMEKQYLIGLIWYAIKSAGVPIYRSHDGRYVIVNHGANSYYDDLAFMLRQYRKHVAAS